MAYIILSVIALFAVMILKSTWSSVKQISFVFLALIFGFTAYTFFSFMGEAEVISKGPSSLFAEIPWLEISLYFFMVAGMAAKYLYDAIGEGNVIQFQKWQLVKPLLVSPIIFGTIYSTVAKDASTIFLLIFSFQNGFFWQTVLYKTQPKDVAPKAP